MERIDHHGNKTRVGYNKGGILDSSRVDTAKKDGSWHNHNMRCNTCSRKRNATRRKNCFVSSDRERRTIGTFQIREEADLHRTRIARIERMNRGIDQIKTVVRVAEGIS